MKKQLESIHGMNKFMRGENLTVRDRATVYLCEVNGFANYGTVSIEQSVVTVLISEGFAFIGNSIIEHARIEGECIFTEATVANTHVSGKISARRTKFYNCEFEKHSQNTFEQCEFSNCSVYTGQFKQCFDTTTNSKIETEAL